MYESNLSESKAIVTNTDIKLSGYKSSFINIPNGIHYYTFINNNINNSFENIYLKLEVYEDK